MAEKMGVRDIRYCAKTGIIIGPILEDNKGVELGLILNGDILPQQVPASYERPPK